MCISIRYANNYASLLMKQRENDNNKVYWKNIWVKVIYQHGLRGMIWKREHTLCEQTLQKHSWSKRNLISFCDVLLKVSQGKILAMCNISIKRNYHELLQLIYMYILHISINKTWYFMKLYIIGNKSTRLSCLHTTREGERNKYTPDKRNLW